MQRTHPYRRHDRSGSARPSAHRWSPVALVVLQLVCNKITHTHTHAHILDINTILVTLTQNCCPKCVLTFSHMALFLQSLKHIGPLPDAVLAHQLADAAGRKLLVTGATSIVICNGYGYGRRRFCVIRRDATAASQCHPRFGHVRRLAGVYATVAAQRRQIQFAGERQRIGLGAGAGSAAARRCQRQQTAGGQIGQTVWRRRV